MTQQSALLIKTLEKIGAPLAAAVEEVSQRARSDMEVGAREVEDSKIIAQLLGQTVQISLSLGASLIQASDESEADALRLAVAAMVAPIIAHNYRQNGVAPDDHALGRITKSLEATLAFAENFNPASDQGSRLSMLGEDTLIFDEAQVDITVLDALVPAINAIGEFSFGLSETKLLQEVLDKLKNKAEILSSGGDKLTELITLKSLAKIYADCHLSQVRKLSGSNNEDSAELSVTPVWQAFDTRLAMLNTILGLAPIEVTSTDAAAPVPQTVPVEASEPVVSPALAEKAATGGGPMSFFSGGDKAVTTPTTPAESPASVAQPQTQTVTTEQSQAAPVETPSSTESASGGGGPMSFFKSDTKKDEGESSS